jgi:hypothetical protein
VGCDLARGRTTVSKYNCAVKPRANGSLVGGYEEGAKKCRRMSGGCAASWWPLPALCASWEGWFRRSGFNQEEIGGVVGHAMAGEALFLQTNVTFFLRCDYARNDANVLRVEDLSWRVFDHMFWISTSSFRG